MSKRLPMYRIIKNFILEQIRSGELKPDDRVPSEKELMNTFNVSRITVRRALDELAAEGYIYRLQGVGAFVHEHPVRKVRTNLIGVLITPVSDYLSVGILRGMERYLDKLGFHPVVQFSTGDPEKESERIQKLRNLNVQGFIIMPHERSLQSQEMRSIMSEGIPVVFVDRAIDGLKGPSVTSDNKKGGYDLVAHLIEVHGSKRIAFVTWEGTNVSSVRDRYLGGLQAAKNLGAQMDLVMCEKEDLQRITEKLSSYDSIFACTDLIAAELLVNFEVNGIKIPDEIRIVGFDDRPFSRYIDPPLTTVHQFPEEIGKKASAILMALLNGETVTEDEHLVPVELVIRSSCGCTGVPPSIKNA